MAPHPHSYLRGYLRGLRGAGPPAAVNQTPDYMQGYEDGLHDRYNVPDGTTRHAMIEAIAKELGLVEWKV
jgi:hypothetical protein